MSPNERGRIRVGTVCRNRSRLNFQIFLFESVSKNQMQLGSGCGSVGRAVASNTTGPRFESSHWQKFIYLLNICLLSTVYWKDENKEKRGWEWPIFKKNQMQILLNQIKQFNHFTYLFPVLSPQLHLSVIDLRNKWPIYIPNRRRTWP